MFLNSLISRKTLATLANTLPQQYPQLNLGNFFKSSSLPQVSEEKAKTVVEGIADNLNLFFEDPEPSLTESKNSTLVEKVKGGPKIGELIDFLIESAIGPSIETRAEGEI